LLARVEVRLPDHALKPPPTGVRDRGAESMATARSATARNLHVVGEPTPTWGVRIRVHGRCNVEGPRPLTNADQHVEAGRHIVSATGTGF